ncbi:MAG: PAS domain S-box protein [Fidelibacterota bacterium]
MKWRFRKIILLLFLFSQIYGKFITSDAPVTYRFLADENSPPYMYTENGQVVGFCVDLIHRITEVMNFQVEIEAGPWDEVRSAVENGEVDGILAMYYSTERDKILDFSIPHSSITHAVFVHAKSPVQSYTDLNHRKIIVQKGSIMHDYLIQNEITRSIITVDNVKDAILLLSHEIYDCALLSKVQGDFYIKKYKLKNIKSLEDYFSPRDYCFAVYNNPKLLHQLNEGLIILQTSGEYNALFQKWMTIPDRPNLFAGPLFRYIIIGVVILVIGIFLTLFWIWFLRKSVIHKTEELRRENQQRRQIEKALRASEENFRSLAENAFDGILINDENGNYIYANNNAAEITGYPVSVLLKLNIRDLTPEENVNDVLEASKKRIRGESVHSFYESLLQRKDGTIIPIEVVASRTDWHNQPADLVFIRDISLRKQMERALQNSEMNFRQIVERSNDAIYVQQDDRFVLVNPALVKLMEYSREELLHPDFDFIHFVDDSDRAKIRERYENRDHKIRISKRCEFKAKTKSGRNLDMEVSASKIIWNNRSASLGIIRDLTRFKRLQEEAFKIEKLDSIGVLAGGIAHDFNNILSVLLGNVQLIKLKIGKEEDLSKYLDRLEETISRATGLTQQLLTFSKGGEPVVEVASIAELIRDVVPFTLTGSNVKSEFVIEDDLYPVEMDVNQISQVLTNIVINAKQAMPGGGKLTVEASNVIIESGDLAGSLEPGEYVKISITDQGIGIPEKIIDKIFDPFFSTKSSGSGLGLATCYSIIQKHGGHITVSSRSGEGSTFTIYLPGTKKRLKKEKKVRRKQKFQGKVLLMDDEESVRDFMSSMLQSLGLSVDAVADGSRAVSHYQKALESGSAHDLVILDLTIPGSKGGKDVLKDLQAMKPDVVAMAYSGYADNPVISRPEDYGFKASFSKPFSIDTLVKVISKVM